MDPLISDLRARAADPARRISAPPSGFQMQAAALDLGELAAAMGGLFGALRGVVNANRAGTVDVAGSRLAESLGQRMATPVLGELPAPAEPVALARAEAALGVALPEELRRIYLEVADGGFGPGEGLLTLERMVVAYRDLLDGDELPRGRSWPRGLLPVVAGGPGWDCVDASSGRVIAWDPEELSERTSEERFQRSFEELFPSVQAWLTDWVGSRTQAEQDAAMMAAAIWDRRGP
jgi:hypothetical protein